MEWSKIPTNLINGKFEDAEILAIVKYQLLYALYEEKPNEKILSRFLTKKQKNIVKNFVSVIQPNVEKEITSVQKKRQTDRLYYAENKEKCKNSDNLSDNLSDNCQPEQIREDKIREDKNIDITLNKQIDTIINSENKNFSKNSDPFINPQIDKTFRMYSEYCNNLLSLNGYKSKKLRESLLDFLNDVNYDFEYIKDVFVKANELKTIIDQPIDLQKIINCHERIANDYYKKLKQSPPKQPYQQEQPRKLTPEEELALYNDPNTYRPY